VKRVFEFVGLVVVMSSVAGLAGCGGGPSTGHVDGADTTSSAPAATNDANGDPAPADPCSQPETGCKCDTEGATLACKGPVLRNGDYVTCSGTRSCVNGHWGLCMPPAYHAPPVPNVTH
jgi:hypothetical protein